MSLSLQQLEELSNTAEKAAIAAAELIQARRPATVESKGIANSASDLVTDVDRAAEKLILGILPTHVGGIELGLLSEEMQDDGSRLTAQFYWCVDPIDGTLPYIESHPGYAVSIALVRRDGRPIVGVVVDPSTKVVYRATRGLGFKRTPGLSKVRSKRLRVFLDRSTVKAEAWEHQKKALETSAEELGLKGIALHLGAGSVLNVCRVLDSSAACYLKPPRLGPGGLRLWDVAATSCLVSEAAMVGKTFGGEPLPLNRSESTSISDLGVLFASSYEVERAVRRNLSEWRES